MDASPRQSHHHHRHYHHHCHFICHHRHRHFICHHAPALPIPTPAPAPGLQIPVPVTSSVIGTEGHNSETLRPEEAKRGGSSAAQMWQGQEYDEQMEDYDDYDEEPVFILTDEWREFFAQSEAKRKKEKKQAKKKGKN